MTKSTITPGTWIIHREKDSEKRRLSVVSDGRTFVCDLQWQVDDRELANAQAIAAVPHMIEALQTITKSINWSETAWRLSQKEMVEICQAALRKAGQID